VRRACALGALLVGCATGSGPRSPVASDSPRANAERPALAVRGSEDEPSEAPEPEPTLEQRLDAFFGGDAYPPPIPPSPQGRVGSMNWGTWIQPAPRSGSLPLGSIRPGDSLPLLAAEPVTGQGRCRSFVQVAGGYVCVGSRSTLDMDSAWMRAGRWTTPAPGPMPYHYALSMNAPMLTRPVPADEFVWKIGKRDRKKMRGWNAGHDELAVDAPITPNGPIPDFLRDGGSVPTPWGKAQGVYKKRIPFGSMLAYTRAFEAFGRTWVLSTDMSVVPAEGLKRFRVSTFHGVELGDDLKLPIAWIRKEPRQKWRKSGEGFEPTGESWPEKQWVSLTGAEERSGKQRFLETREPGIYIARSDATLVEKRAKPPWETQGTGKWIHIRVNRGTLTLYQGPNPVFTTLISPGQKDATPYGRYFIESKHHVSTMTTESGEPRRFWIADVPWTIYFKRPYAIHATYWHEDFGQRKSGGCVNLSPLDAERVFGWVGPALPEGWGSVQQVGPGGTFVLVEG
jgi:hypothetical protein